MINQTIVMYVVAGVLAVLLIVLVLEFFLLRNKLNRLYRKYMYFCLLYTSPSPRDGLLSRMPSSA